MEAKEAAMKKESGLAQALKEARQLGADQLATIAELKALLAAKSLEVFVFTITTICVVGFNHVSCTQHFLHRFA